MTNHRARFPHEFNDGDPFAAYTEAETDRAMRRLVDDIRSEKRGSFSDKTTDDPPLLGPEGNDANQCVIWCAAAGLVILAVYAVFTLTGGAM